MHGESLVADGVFPSLCGRLPQSARDVCVYGPLSSSLRLVAAVQGRGKVVPTHATFATAVPVLSIRRQVPPLSTQISANVGKDDMEEVRIRKRKERRDRMQGGKCWGGV